MRILLTMLLSLILSSLAISQNLPGSIYTYEGIDNNVTGIIKVEYFVNEKGFVVPESVKLLQGVGYGMDERVLEIHKKDTTNYKSMHYSVFTPIYQKAGQPAPPFYPGFKYQNYDITKENYPWYDYRILKAEKLLAAGNDEEARKLFEYLLRMKVYQKRAYTGLASIYEKRSETERAKKALQEAGKYKDE